MDTGQKWVDLTVPVREGMVHWPGDPDPVISAKVFAEEVEDVRVTFLNMSAHTGTHVDAPLHFIREGNDVTALPLDLLIGPVRIIETDVDGDITAATVQTFWPERGERIFFKTRNSRSNWWEEPFKEEYVAISPDAAQMLVDRGVKVIGVDYLSVGNLQNGAETHRILLGNEVLIIEGLDLTQVQPGYYDMICLPLKLQGADGAPARVLIKPRL